MAIKRCPYCKAIIDESSGYCSNCGTQLLFPEDEFIEEEIPGDKIVDEDELPPEKLEQAEKEKTASKTDILKEAAETEEEEKEEIEKFLESVKKERANRAKKVSETLKEKLPPGQPEKIETEEEISIKEKKPVIPESGEMFTKSGKIAFKTEELDQIPDARTKEREEIEKFLESLKDEKAEKEAPKVPAIEDREKAEIESFLKSINKEEEIPEEEIPLRPKEIEPETSKTEEELPPWAEKMKKGEAQEFEVAAEEKEGPELGEIEVEEEEATIREEFPLPETGAELRRGVEQISLPFDREIQLKKEALRRRRPSRWITWLESRAFDFLSIAALWLISLWIASRLTAVSIFRLISASAIQVLGFYLVLLVLYYSFFMLLLGETPGDRLFSKED